MVIFISIVFAGCGGVYMTTTDDPLPVGGISAIAPTVTFTDPADGDTNVFINSQMIASFSEVMDFSTITESSFILMQGQTTVLGTVTSSDSVAIFTPTNDLATNTKYKATITTGAKDLAGNALVSDYEWGFTTGIVPDTTAPTVNFTDPADGDTDVFINREISLSFSEEMDVLTINPFSFTVAGLDGISIVGTIDLDDTNKIATFTPDSDLESNITYTATITTDVQDLAGNALDNNYVWEFTTAATPDDTSPTISPTDPTPTDFEIFSLGEVHGQYGWTSGHGSSTCPVYDVEVVSNDYDYTTFETQSLRISNAITCGSFNDQTFSPSLVNEAGEMTASTSVYSGGTRQNYFEAQWDFTSAEPLSEQAGLSVVASPNRGDTARMSWLQMQDTPLGLQLNFEDYQRSAANFILTPIATGLDRFVTHTVKITMQFVDGDSNDVVKIYLDGVLIHTGTSWEDYFRDFEGGFSRAVDSIMFRVAGTAAPENLGKGFVIDNFSSFSGPAQ